MEKSSSWMSISRSQLLCLWRPCRWPYLFGPARCHCSYSLQGFLVAGPSLANSLIAYAPLCQHHSRWVCAMGSRSFHVPSDQRPTQLPLLRLHHAENCDVSVCRGPLSQSADPMTWSIHAAIELCRGVPSVVCLAELGGHQRKSDFFSNCSDLNQAVSTCFNLSHCHMSHLASMSFEYRL